MTEENVARAEPTIGAFPGKGKTSRPAIWSLVCGVLSFLCLPALPGIILGIIALVAISNSKGKLRGVGLAIAGMIMSVVIPTVTLFVGLVIIAIAFPAFLTTKTHHSSADIWAPGDYINQGQNDENMLSEQMSNNESMSIAEMKLLTNAEVVWIQQDPDGNGIKDYWTYDVSCLHRMCRADKATKIALISLELAQADANMTASGDFGVLPLIEDWADAECNPKNGYYFQAMELDENGEPYNQEDVGETKIKATNKTKFGFVAYPAEYSQTGRQTFIVNEQGTIYTIDVNPDIYGIALEWPRNNKNGDPYAKNNWKVVD